MPREKHESKPEVLEMFASVDIHSPVAVYSQIENHVQFAIAAGRLKAGDRLPSVRELSEQLKVNPNTVAKAYRDLEVMGLLYTRRGMGVFIMKGVEKRCREDCWQRVARRIYDAACEARAAGMSKKMFDTIASKSYATGNAPYGDLPNDVVKAAKP